MFSLWLVEFVLVAAVTSFLFTMQPGSYSGSWESFPHVADTAIALAVTISTMSVAIGLYRAEICLHSRHFIINATVVGVLTFAALTLMSMGRVFDFGLQRSDTWLKMPVVEALAGWIVCLIVTRLLFNTALKMNLFSRRILVVGSSWSASRVQDVISARQPGFCQVVGYTDPDAIITRHELRRRKIWGLVVAEEDEAAAGPGRLASYQERGVVVLSEVAFRELRLQSLDIDTLPANWLASMKPGRRDTLHRSLDLLVSVAFLVATLPLMIITSVAIKLNSEGPVFYGQERVGLNGRPFTLWKFRSMSVDAEALGKPVWAAKNDPRVTGVGRFIRRTRIDELPQLLNVLSGEMSFIGPRPERPQFVERLSESVPHYTDRASVKPGITGWAQVNFPYGASIEDARKKLSYDLYYVKHRSMLLHMLIMVATVRVILFQEGSR